MIKDNLDFLSNNVKGTQTSEKNWSYFVICIFKKITGLAIFHKKHSSPDIKRKWNDNFRGQLFFPRGKTNSCLVAIRYHGEILFSYWTKITIKWDTF